ncbi:recombinase family protein [Streptomyces zaomyceticus]|uniref:recombinase family protein n=1 Tax=Streptomyces zaomyceticus TaxID=68286 RepID=UPI003431BC50
MSTRVRGRPKFEAALAATREIKAHAPHCRVIFTVYEMKRLGRDAAELTALADHLAAHGLVLEMLAGALAGIYDPTGHGRLPFAFFAAMAATERDNTRVHPPARRRRTVWSMPSVMTGGRPPCLPFRGGPARYATSRCPRARRRGGGTVRPRVSRPGSGSTAATPGRWTSWPPTR